MEMPPMISYEELLEKVNLYRQGIMPTRETQEWYNRRPRPICVRLNTDDTFTNPPDTDDHTLSTAQDVNALTPGRLYDIIMFRGQDFEERYLYEGVYHDESDDESDDDTDDDTDDD